MFTLFSLQINMYKAIYFDIADNTRNEPKHKICIFHLMYLKKIRLSFNNTQPPKFQGIHTQILAV